MQSLRDKTEGLLRVAYQTLDMLTEEFDYEDNMRGDLGQLVRAERDQIWSLMQMIKRLNMYLDD